MRRKFVQIAAIFLAFSMLPISYAAAEPDTGANIQQTEQVNTTDTDPSSENIETDVAENPEGATAAEGDSASVDNESVGDEPNPEQEENESGSEVTDPEQGTTDPEQGTTDPEQGTTDPEQGTTDPEQGTTDPEQGTTDPEQGTTDPGSETTDPEQGTTDPEQGNTEPEVPEVVVPILETEEEAGKLLRVGLSYGSNALTSANLQNSVGTGYRFGFHDGAVFNQVGNTSETKISVLKTQNLYYTPVMPDGYSGYAAAETSGPAVGCVHLQLPGTYATFVETKAAADAVGGFPAWINGEFVVRYGVFLTADAAREAQTAKGFADAAVVGTSEYGLIVVITGTNTPVFQYDGGSDCPMFVVKPGVDNAVKTVTYYKGIQYYGSFRYERMNGGDITVVNLVDIDDYVRGVIPYEMSPSFPLEALKAQTVAARSYAVSNTNINHQKLHFDVCTTTCCQVYYGTGGATEHTDRAVDETAGQYAWYEGKPILAVFQSSDGGATENSENVWFEALPYLRGVIDPYEETVEDKINAFYSYRWTKSYTGVQLQEILNAKGYQCTEIVDVKLKNTDVGNVHSITFVDANGKNWTISKDSLRITFGFKSLRFSLADDRDDYVLSNSTTLESLNGVWTLNGNGELVQVSVSPVYAMTAEGVVVVPGSELSGRTFVFNGAGRGHNLGLSQWGAYAMAKEGFTYDQILKFYFTGIEIHK